MSLRDAAGDTAGSSASICHTSTRLQRGPSAFLENITFKILDFILSRMDVKLGGAAARGLHTWIQSRHSAGPTLSDPRSPFSLFIKCWTKQRFSAVIMGRFIPASDPEGRAMPPPPARPPSPPIGGWVKRGEAVFHRGKR